MKEYKFQYTKISDTLVVGLPAIAVFFLTEIICIYNKVNFALAIIISFGLSFLLFQIFKRKAVRICTAKLCDTSVEFDFTNEIKLINFGDLISFKDYNGRNGPVLYLKTQTENFRLFANNNFCKTKDFKVFCDDTMIQLDKYKYKNNLTLIHEGSIFTKKGMLYFLILATLIYLFAFFIETTALRIAVGIPGGFFFFVMWTKYLIENSKAKSQNGS